MRSLIVAVSFLAVLALVHGHGRLVKPAGRATLWRNPEFAKYNPPRNYDDTQLFCGGVYVRTKYVTVPWKFWIIACKLDFQKQVQYDLNNGSCGICGDPFNEPQPRTHEGGGMFGRGIIVGEYKAGQVRGNRIVPTTWCVIIRQC